MTTQAILFSNNASSTLAGAISNVSTSVNLAPGTGVLFPAPGAGQFFVMTFTDVATGLLNEIVHVTAVSGDTVTIVRAQEGTTALNWQAGDLANNRLTAGQMAAMAQLTDAVLFQGGGTGVVLQSQGVGCSPTVPPSGNIPSVTVSGSSPSGNPGIVGALWIN